MYYNPKHEQTAESGKRTSPVDAGSEATDTGEADRREEQGFTIRAKKRAEENTDGVKTGAHDTWEYLAGAEFDWLTPNRVNQQGSERGASRRGTVSRGATHRKTGVGKPRKACRRRKASVADRVSSEREVACVADSVSSEREEACVADSVSSEREKACVADSETSEREEVCVGTGHKRGTGRRLPQEKRSERESRDADWKSAAMEKPGHVVLGLPRNPPKCSGN